MGEAEKLALQRFLRNLLALILSQIIAILTKQQAFIFLAPILNAFAKYLREKEKTRKIPL